MATQRAKSVVSKALLFILVTMALLANVGCKSLDALETVDYEFGDVSRTYCACTDEKLREILKATLAANGLTIGVDYCSTVGLVDALLLQPIQREKE